jgi:glycosyltransferase involved in cell wall biosynthesis
MKILLLTSYFYPEKSASVYLNKNRNESFIKSNFNIEIYTPYPTRGVSEHVRKEYINKKSEVLYGGQMLIHRFALFREGRSSILRAIRYFLCCCIQFFKGCMAKDVNMMFISSTPPIQGAMAALIKKVRGFPIVYNLQDIFPDSLVSTGLTKKGSFLWKIGRIIEDFTYRNADKIVVISEDFKKNIMAKGVPEDKITVIYNWVEEDKVFPVSRDENKLFNELGLEKFLFYVVYAGNLGYAQNIRVLIDAASLLSDYKDVQFVIFGQKNKINEYNEIINRLNLNNVKLFHLQDYSRVSSVYSLGDIDIVSCKAGFGGVGVPSKT